MIPLLATMFKELLLLVRDRSGLLVLFVMPAVLVVVVSLVQENVLKTTGDAAMDILFIDQDHQDFGKRIQKELGVLHSRQPCYNSGRAGDRRSAVPGPGGKRPLSGLYRHPLGNKPGSTTAGHGPDF